MQFDAAPLETAFLQNVARRGVADPRTRRQLSDIESLEGEIDHRASRFGAEPATPMLDAEPVAELRRVRLAPVDADNPDGDKLVFDQERCVRIAARSRTNELNRMIPRIGMRQAPGILRDAPIIGESRNGVYVREGWPAQDQSFGLKDATTWLARRYRCRCREFLQHV